MPRQQNVFNWTVHPSNYYKRQPTSPIITQIVYSSPHYVAILLMKWILESTWCGTKFGIIYISPKRLHSCGVDLQTISFQRKTTRLGDNYPIRHVESSLYPDISFPICEHSIPVCREISPCWRIYSQVKVIVPPTVGYLKLKWVPICSCGWMEIQGAWEMSRLCS